jgi:hypothetical protein
MIWARLRARSILESPIERKAGADLMLARRTVREAANRSGSGTDGEDVLADPEVTL